MCKSKIIGAGFILALAFSLSAEAKLYKWVDDKGDTHYGDVIPPEYASKDKEEEAAKNVVNKNEIEEKNRRVNALLNTYSSEKEIDQALERNLVLLNARFESNNILLKSSQNALDNFKNEAANRSKEGKKIPQSLYDDISLTEAKVIRLQSERIKSEEALKSEKARFESDKIFYRKIVAANPVKYVDNHDTPYPDSDYPEYRTNGKYSKTAKRARY